MRAFNKIVLTPIGKVSSPNKGQMHPEEVKTLLSDVIIYPQFADGLYKIEYYSHLIILYYCHVLKKELGKPLRVHLRGDLKLPEVGVLASRAQNRPNPIGLSVVKLIARKGNVLTVEGLDALDGSPVLDVKPYNPSVDSIENASSPPIIK